jgi:hypothetical protein
MSSARALLRWQFRLGHVLLGAALDRPDPPAAAGACYARAVVGEDLSISVLAARAPLALSTWRARTGLSELPPPATSADWRSWARRVRVDLGQPRRYRSAVYAATDTYLAGLTEDALDPAHAESTVCLLSALLLTTAVRRGQIACLAPAVASR